MINRILCPLFILLFIVLFNTANAQKPEIKGDTIFATNEFPILIKFPSNNIDPRFTSPNTPYKVEAVGSNITVLALSDSGKSFPLVVNEGKRSHTFIVSFKKNIDANNIDNVIYNYSTVKLLQQRVRQIEAREKAKIATMAGSSPEVVKIPALLEEGDKAYNKGMFDEAQSKFEEVLKIQPGNEEAIKEINKIKDTRNQIVILKSTAIKSLNDENYDAALAAFNKVLDLNSNDVFSQSQVATIQRIKSQTQARNEDRRNDSIIYNLEEKAKIAFSDKQYVDAIDAYEKLINLNPINPIWKRQVEEIKRIQSNIPEVKESENFKTLVANADKAFSDSNYEVARAGYIAAKTSKPKDKSVDEKLQKTEEKILSKKNEDEYKTAVVAGDKAFDNKNFEKAKTEYKKALDIFKDSLYPSQKIELSNKQIEILEKVKENDKQYMVAIVNADKAFTDRDYSNAKLNYNEASKLKPEEAYPKTKIAEIDSSLESIAKSKELNIKFDSAMARGDTALNKKDFNTAKTEFTLASELKPTEQEPKNKLELIENQQNPGILNTRFDSAMAKGNIAIRDQDYALALQYFKEANRIKPAEANSLSQLKYVQGLVTQNALNQEKIQGEAVRRANEEIRIKRFREGMSARTKFEKAAQVSDYVMELFYLKAFLNIIPDASELSQYQGNPDQMIDDAKLKIQQIREFLTRKKGAKYQAEAIPYLNVDLEKKYEDINFTTLPEGQKIDSVDSAANEEYLNVSNEILLEKPYLSLSDSLNKIKITCVAIKFKKGEAFYKFQIENSDSAEFLTGLMQMNLLKKSGDTIKANANFISSFPIVLPGKEFSIIYGSKDIPVDNEDTLSFQLYDRLKKNSFKISIPGRVYNQEKQKI